jgi:hypothetical protein
MPWTGSVDRPAVMGARPQAHVVDLPPTLLARDTVLPAERNALAVRARRGELVRLIRGAYISADDWARLGAADRSRIRARAALATRTGDGVVSHQSAVAEWGLPWVGPFDGRVHLLSASGASTAIVRRYREGCDDPVMRDGVPVTSIARTVIDVARTAPAACAVVVADAALTGSSSAGRQPVARLDLQLELERIPRFHGDVRAATMVAFADGRAESPGESLSRWSMHRARVAQPVLQQTFPRDDGGEWRVDFWWPASGIVGEFDGRSKYIDPAQRAGRSPEQVLYDEKRREDEIRRHCRGFVRWDYATALSPRRLAALLAASGVPIERRHAG